MGRRLAEVAAKVGVSEATVSRVLNNKSGVSDATRAAVLTALDVLGYERATQLRGERARLVGLVLPELQNPIFPALADVVGDALAQQGFTPVLCTRTAGGVSEAEYIDLLLQHRVSGVVFAGGLYAQTEAPHGHYRRLADRKLPVVLVNAGVEHLGYPRVSCDDAVAVDQALTHLLALGHECIGLVLGPADHVPSARKLAAFQAGVKAAGVKAAGTKAAGLDASADLVEHTMFSLEGGHVAASKLLERGATAMICASDVLALGSIRAARRRGMSVPEQVSVIGYDDSPLMNCMAPALTTVRQPIEAMGRAAVELLVAQMDRAEVPPDELLFEPELVVRASTAPTARAR